MTLKQIRQLIVKNLWENYRNTSSQARLIEQKLANKGIFPLYFDHFAMIDLPGPHTGIPYLSELFMLLGYTKRGQGYLPDRQNDFVWMAEIDSTNRLAHQVLPQIVVADFRLQELPYPVKKIIEKYAMHASPPPLHFIHTLTQQIGENDHNAASTLIHSICHYLTNRDWPLPTLAEFMTVWEFNQLLAWVLVFGRKPNHFTLSIHLLSAFADLETFHQFIEQELQITLNQTGGVIKGGRSAGMAQSATDGELEPIHLSDGCAELPTGFVEFVWRYAHPTSQNPILWDDFFTGFITHHATHVIQSLSNPNFSGE
jgi:hypothetical protein